MKQVTLSRRSISGTVVNWLDAPGFPQQVCIALEHDVGFGESSGGVGVGSVIDWTTDPDQGYFGAAAPVDEVVLNIPNRHDLVRFFGADSEQEVLELSPTMKRRLADDYPWEFAERFGDIHIEWE